MRLEQVIETPGLYRLVVDWDSIEAHMVTFRAGQGYQDWRALVAPFFTAPPQVSHSRAVP